jgi:hypothetical protein
MPRRQEFWGWIVFILGAGAYLPIAIGGWQHPTEVNMASYSIWLIISGMLLYSSHSQGFAGWRMPLGFFFGNGSLLVLGFTRGGYTFNLGQAETIALYGVIGTLSLWVAVGTVTKKWKPRILFLGGVTADILSFYPQLKQYLLPHEPPTDLMISGWCLWILMAFINVFLVEEFYKKLTMPRTVYEQRYEKSKSMLLIAEESIFSIENGVFMIVTVLVMVR